jgi:hypothetical protein
VTARTCSRIARERITNNRRMGHLLETPWLLGSGLATE